MSLSQKIAQKISTETNADKEHSAVILYGTIAIVHSSFFLLLITGLGIASNHLLPIWVVCMSSAILRTNSGGVHANTSNNCTIIGGIVCLILAITSQYLSSLIQASFIFIVIGVICFILCFAGIYFLAPVDTKNKPIKTEKKRKRMRRNSFITLCIYLVLSVLFIYLGEENSIFLSVFICLCSGMLWQIFMLTKLGAKFAQIIQKPLDTLTKRLSPK